MDIAETTCINGHFSNVAWVLAQDIAVIDVSPEPYLEPTESLFSLQIPSINISFSFLPRIDEKKATGLDRILSKLLKVAASIVDLLFPPFFQSLFSRGYIQMTGERPN